MVTHAPTPHTYFSRQLQDVQAVARQGHGKGGLCFETEWLLVRYSKEDKNRVD